MKVYLHLAEGFEEIEALTVVDVLRRAGIDVEMVSISESIEVKGAHDIRVIADKFFEQADYSHCDMIVLPGGMPGTTNLGAHAGLTGHLKEFAAQNKWIGAICAAPSILGKLGLLSGKKAACFPGFEKDLQGAALSNDPVVLDGTIITSRGAGTAMSFALKIVEVLKDKKTANVLKEKMIVKS